MSMLEVSCKTCFYDLESRLSGEHCGRCDGETGWEPNQELEPYYLQAKIAEMTERLEGLKCCGNCVFETDEKHKIFCAACKRQGTNHFWELRKRG